MDQRDIVTRRKFLATGAAGAAGWPRAARRRPSAHRRPQKFHVKPLPADIFIDHGINQETRLETLRGYLTPASHFFVRNHATTPVLDVRTWRLRVEGNAVERPVELSFDDLLRLPSRSVIATSSAQATGAGSSRSSWARWPRARSGGSAASGWRSGRASPWERSSSSPGSGATPRATS